MDHYSQTDAPAESFADKPKARSGSKPTKEAKRLQMARYRARYPSKLRLYWAAYKRAKRAEAAARSLADDC